MFLVSIMVNIQRRSGEAVSVRLLSPHPVEPEAHRAGSQKRCRVGRTSWNPGTHRHRLEPMRTYCSLSVLVASDLDGVGILQKLRPLSEKLKEDPGEAEAVSGPGPDADSCQQDEPVGK